MTSYVIYVCMNIYVYIFLIHLDNNIPAEGWSIKDIKILQEFLISEPAYKAKADQFDTTKK